MDEVRARFEPVVGSSFELSRGETRWMAMGDEFVAFGADDDGDWQRLEREGWLIDRWRDAGIRAPRVVRADAVRRIQVRERLHGVTGHAVEPRIWPGAIPDAWARLDDAPLSAFGERLAASYGELARRIRSAVSIADAIAAGLGPTSRRTLDLDTAIASFHRSSAPAAAKRIADRARTWLAAIPPADAVIHADLHFFNMCLDEEGAIAGVWDLGDAGLDAAATELLIVHSLGSRFAALAIEAYGPVDVEAVRRAQLRTAFDHMIWNAPGTERYPSIVAWVTAALERLAP
jgi:hypothetical protein